MFYWRIKSTNIGRVSAVTKRWLVLIGPWAERQGRETAHCLRDTPRFKTLMHTEAQQTSEVGVLTWDPLMGCWLAEVWVMTTPRGATEGGNSERGGHIRCLLTLVLVSQVKTYRSAAPRLCRLCSNPSSRGHRNHHSRNKSYWALRHAYIPLCLHPPVLPG